MEDTRAPPNMPAILDLSKALSESCEIVEDTGLIDEPARPARPAILDEDPPKTMSESVEIVYDDCTDESVHQSSS